jgi:hypothetical protein
MVIRLDREEFNPPAEFLLLGLSSALKEYSLAHHINTRLRFELGREVDINDQDEANGLPVYARFRWDDQLACRSVQLLANRPLVLEETTRPGDLFGSETVRLLVPELPKADYMLQFFGNFEPNEVEEFRDLLHDIPGVNMAFVTDPNSLKDITPLLY